MLCPSYMVPESTSPTTTTQSVLIGNAETPPLWRDSWLKHVPFVGKILVCLMNAMRYQTTLEQNAEFIAADLELDGSQWVGMRVGTIDSTR